MSEDRKDLFENDMKKEAQGYSENPETISDDSDVNIYESKYTVGDREWFSDDFEETVKNAVPEDKAISIYKPKQKKIRKFAKSPVFAAVISSVLTCAICLSIFALAYKPASNTLNGYILPPASQENAAKPMVSSTSDYKGGIPEVYEKASPSVVSILCMSGTNNYMQSSQAMSSGSGIVIRGDGYIVTNNHVIDGAAKITVTTIAGQNFDASVVGADERTDLAVLKVKSDTQLPYAELGDSSELRVGELAIAIGNPLREELAGTLTVGYISAINRTMVIDGKQMTMIQTDAAINPGNSGGALLNSRGQVIGINTAKSTGYDVEGLGFAIPINEAKPIIEAIIVHGYVTGRPLIGLVGRAVTEAVAKANNLPIGVYVVEVSEYGAAERAGIRAGDVIVECEGEKVENVDDINKIRDQHKPGEVITFKIDRNGSKLNVSVTLQEEKPTEEAKATDAPPQQDYGYSYPFPSDFFSWFGW
ncbi:MAG: trypsin-like peptidase domain-containing protein [Clostridia bacterium]|nr:trypsin-like peptidase domain-containing protein [Clostridia bacterium]